MNAIICGSRNGLGVLVERALGEFDRERFELTHLYVGSFQGVDQEAFYWALRNERPATVMPAEWKKYGSIGGPVRNERMLLMSARAVLAFPGGKGTASMVGIARRHFIPVWRWAGAEWRHETARRAEERDHG